MMSNFVSVKVAALSCHIGKRFLDRGNEKSYSNAMKLLKSLKNGLTFVRRMGYMAENRDQYWLDRVGTREMVGFGFNGTPCYMDRADYPFPAIRWKETTAEIQSLHEKQKGDWRLLSKEEKKTLYRASFCQTFAEFEASRGDWMEPVGYALIMCSMGIWLFIFIRLCVYSELPESFKPSWQRAQLRRQIDLQMNPITGLASEWNYENNDWKRKTWRTPQNPFVKCDDDRS